MDEVISAVVAGATMASRRITNDLVTDAYTALKRYVASSLPNVDARQIEQIESDPESDDYRTALAQSLRGCDAAALTKAVVLARNLLLAIRELNTANNESANGVSDFSVGQSDTILPIFLDQESKERIVAGFPLGPAVDAHRVDVSGIAQELAKNPDAALAQMVVQNANRLRQSVDPDKPPPALVLDNLPSPLLVGFRYYWFQVVHQSLVRGPRMAISLLLSLPLSTWTVHGEATYRRLEGVFRDAQK